MAVSRAKDRTGCCARLCCSRTAAVSVWGAWCWALIEEEAESAGVERLHLLTTTAARFFRTQDYADAARASAPAEIASSAEFTRLCPANAAYLVKSLTAPS